MKNIDDLLRDADFDNAEPNEGHFERFRDKLENKQLPQKKKFQISAMFLKTAVVLALVGLSAFFTYNNFFISESVAAPNGLTLSDVSDEYREIETYLQTEVNQKIEEFQNLECSSDVIQKEVVLSELNELDTTYKALQQELLQNANDERIINAMINSYQKKVEILDHVINQVNERCK